MNQMEEKNPFQVGDEVECRCATKHVGIIRSISGCYADIDTIYQNTFLRHHHSVLTLISRAKNTTSNLLREQTTALEHALKQDWNTYNSQIEYIEKIEDLSEKLDETLQGIKAKTKKVRELLCLKQMKETTLRVSKNRIEMEKNQLDKLQKEIEETEKQLS